ncbi:MAG: hypothetical protein IJ716_00795 [Lachnospiraceae bacterium]|nr:hypothetical protein [Lachnospiraceae bacterium]
MKFYVLASLIVFIWIIGHNLRKSKRIQSEAEARFWERERLANETRRKPLDNLDYVRIPLEELPMHLMEDNEQVAGCLQIINELSLQPIVNLTGYTNTDLKLEYGTANITVLTEYDQSYTLLVNTLQTWAKLLYDAGYVEETRKILEFAVSTRTDVTASYDLLADIYLQDAAPEKIQTLLSTAENLNSLSKQVILRHLQEKLPQAAPS